MSSKKFLLRRSSQQKNNPLEQLAADRKERQEKQTVTPKVNIPKKKHEIDPDALLAELENFEMGDVFAQTITHRYRTGDKIEGTIQSIEQDIALVSIGGKSEATMNVDHTYTIGQKIQATIVQTGHRGIVLAHKIHQGSNLEVYEVAQEQKLPVKGTVIEENKGGFVVQFGDIRGFCPKSQIGFRHEEQTYLQQEFSFLITEIKENELICSRRVLLEKEREEKENERINALSKGKKYTGTIRNITDFGTFVDLNGVDGLLPISQTKEQDIQLEVGKTIDVIIQSIQGKRISLALPGAKRKALKGFNDSESKQTIGDAFGSLLDQMVEKPSSTKKSLRKKR